MTQGFKWSLVCNILIYIKRRCVLMAKDGNGKKFNRIPAHTREQNGKTVEVKEHVRSNRTDSKGKK